jgi:hypothetical protein
MIFANKSVKRIVFMEDVRGATSSALLLCVLAPCGGVGDSVQGWSSQRSLNIRTNSTYEQQQNPTTLQIQQRVGSLYTQNTHFSVSRVYMVRDIASKKYKILPIEYPRPPKPDTVYHPMGQREVLQKLILRTRCHHQSIDLR